jgi:general secretion pathway protein C
MDLSGTQAAPRGVATPHWLEHVEQWLAKRWVPVLVNLIALALLCFTLAQGTWRLLTPPASSDATPGIGAANETSDYNLQALLSANLFGQAAPATKGAESLETIPLSSLNLVLTGVMVTPAGSFGLISSDGGPELPFSIGQDIVAGVSLYAVYADRVLIQRGGTTESLMLKDTGPNLPEGSVVTASPPRPSGAGARRRGESNRGESNFAVSRQELTQQMQKPDFLTQALMVPNAGGGFLVREIQPGSVYEKLGLRVGDVIQSVNGQPVNTMEDVMRLYQQFDSATNVSLDVRRAGRTETLVYNFQ